MANALYPKFKESLLSQNPSVDLDADTIKVALVDTGTYTYSASHQYYSSVSAAVVGTPQTLGSKTVTNGVFDAADVTFSAVSGNSVEALVIYKDTGNAATSPLIAYLDTVASGLPVTPNSGDISVTWDNGSNRIFAL
jgi:hypothetical protein